MRMRVASTAGRSGPSSTMWRNTDPATGEMATPGLGGPHPVQLAAVRDALQVDDGVLQPMSPRSVRHAGDPSEGSPSEQVLFSW